MYIGLIKARYPNLKGKNWINQLSAEDKKFFIDLGMRYNLHGKLGGMVRANTAERDEHGRFKSSTRI